MLALPSNCVLIIVAWLALIVISQSSEFAGAASTVEAGVDDRGAAVFMEIGDIPKVISNSSQLASVGSTVGVGFDYRGLACINRDAQTF